MSENDERFSLLSELIKMAKADSDVRESEFQFLAILAEQIGVSPEEFKVLFDQYIEFHPPAFEFDRIVQLQRLVLLMNVDQIIDEKELQLIHEQGLRLGLNPQAVNEVLLKMDDYPNKMLPPEKLISIFQTYHN